MQDTKEQKNSKPKSNRGRKKKVESVEEFDIDKIEVNRVDKTEKKTTKKSDSGQIKIKVDDKTDLVELNLDKNVFYVVVESNDYKIYINNSKSFITADKSNLKICYKKLYLDLNREKDSYRLVTNQNINLDERVNVNNLLKEKDSISFNINNLNKVMLKSNIIEIENDEFSSDEVKDVVKDNKKLVISEEEGKVYLPYSAEDVKNEFSKIKDKNITISEIIEKNYVRSTKIYKNSMKSRYKEGYNLMRKKENKSIRESVWLGLELMFEFNLHPAIISACKNLEELDIYLDCLDDNELDKFSCFDIIYKAMPVMVKGKKVQVS